MACLASATGVLCMAVFPAAAPASSVSFSKTSIARFPAAPVSVKPLSRRYSSGFIVRANNPEAELKEKVAESINNAMETCKGNETSEECAVAWDESEELASALADKLPIQLLAQHLCGEQYNSSLRCKKIVKFLEKDPALKFVAGVFAVYSCVLGYPLDVLELEYVNGVPSMGCPRRFVKYVRSLCKCSTYFDLLRSETGRGSDLLIFVLDA
ncbi:hypothetical protein R1flu_009799 [Riccia fluitans]|uniref:CP12 domain-containing protein n=1 Tax=Riccia fluitans TaxID=41844 RepID=A0ABD1Z7C6_9MARC